MISSGLRWGLLVAAALLRGAAAQGGHLVTIVAEKPEPGSGLCLIPCAFVKSLPAEMFSYSMMATMNGYGLSTQICGMEGGYVLGDQMTQRLDPNLDPYNSLICGQGDISADGNYPCYMATSMLCGEGYNGDFGDDGNGHGGAAPPYSPDDVTDGSGGIKDFDSNPTAPPGRPGRPIRAQLPTSPGFPVRIPPNQPIAPSSPPRPTNPGRAGRPIVSPSPPPSLPSPPPSYPSYPPAYAPSYPPTYGSYPPAYGSYPPAYPPTQ